MIKTGWGELFHLAGSFHKCPQWLGLDLVKTRISNCTWVSHVRSGDPSTWAITCDLQGAHWQEPGLKAGAMLESRLWNEQSRCPKWQLSALYGNACPSDVFNGDKPEVKLFMVS